MTALFTEQTYTRAMHEIVEPYLNAHGASFFLAREADRTIHVLLYRTEKEAKGTILVSHGFTENIEKYKEFIYYLLQRGYHVCFPEHCGHGHSYRLTDDPSLVHVDSWQRYVSDLLFTARRIKHAVPLPLYLYGHSMGGGIAAAAISADPALFTKAILSSPMIRPLTMPVPYRTAKRIAAHFCRNGRSDRYVAGQKPYGKPESFEKSCGTSRSRFDLYQEKRKKDPLFQLSAPSYGWLHAAAELNRYLQHRGYLQIQIPVLLFQAQDERLVSKKEQERFIRKLKRRGLNAALIRVPGTKHEILNSNTLVLHTYLKHLISFFS